MQAITRDSAYGRPVGYTNPYTSPYLLADSLPGVRDSRVVMRFAAVAPRGLIGTDTTTGAVIGVDSLWLRLTITQRDTATRNLRLFDFVHQHAHRKEDRHHLEQWRPYILRINAVARAWQESLEWFGPEDEEVDELQRQGKLAYGVRDLRRLLAERAEIPPPDAGIAWSKWDPVRRRTAPGGIDQATRDMLQGLAEKRYMPAGSG